MEKVMQDKFGLGGNCQSATLATILGIPLRSVPNFWEGCDLENPDSEANGVIFNNNFNRFLANFNLTSIQLGVTEGDHTEWVVSISSHLKDIPLLVSGPSPRGYNHSVIYMNGELFHDPHPEGGGVTPQCVAFLMPTFAKVTRSALELAFKEGFRMGTESMTWNENIPCWQDEAEAWANSDAEEHDCEEHYTEITTVHDEKRKYLCTICGKEKIDEDINIPLSP